MENQALKEGHERKVGERRYQKHRNAWGKTLTKNEQLLVHDIVYSLRGKSVHAAQGISLYPSSVRVTANNLDNPATITLGEGGSWQVSVDHGLTGDFEDLTGTPPLDADILAGGPTIHTHVSAGDSTTDLVARPEGWKFNDSKLFEGSISLCSQGVELAGKFLRDFRSRTNTN